jgi:hypothetical protein
MPSKAGLMKELYCWNHKNEFRTRYLSVPTIHSGGRTAIEIRALLPNLCVGFININLTKEKGHAGSVRVLVYW